MAKKRRNPASQPRRRKRPPPSAPSAGIGEPEAKKAKPVNKFDLHYNKEKHVVLNRHPKFQTQPTNCTVSRWKGLQKRKETLLPQLEKGNKSNRFVDKRIGSKGAAAAAAEDYEEAAFRKFSLQRQNLVTSRGKERFNLEDEGGAMEELTHLGQSIGEMEKFVSEKTTGGDGSDSEDEKLFRRLDMNRGMASFKDKMNSVIAQAKVAKLEKQRDIEHVLQITEELDNKFLPLRSQLQYNNSIVEALNKQAADPKSSNFDDFAKIMADLDSSRQRAKASDRVEEPESLEPFAVDVADDENVDGSDDVPPVQPAFNMRALPKNHVSADALGDEPFCKVSSGKKLSIAYTQDCRPILPEGMTELPLQEVFASVRSTHQETQSAAAALAEHGFHVSDLEDEGESDDETGDDLSDEDETAESDGYQEDDDEEDGDEEEDDGNAAEEVIPSHESEQTEPLPQDFPHQSDEFRSLLLSKTSSDIDRYLEELRQKLFVRNDYKRTCRKLLENLLHVQMSLASRNSLDRETMNILFTHIRAICCKNKVASVAVFRSQMSSCLESLRSARMPGNDVCVLITMTTKIYSVDCEWLVVPLQTLLSRCVRGCRQFQRCVEVKRALELCDLWLTQARGRRRRLVPEVVTCTERILRDFGSGRFPPDFKQQHPVILIDALTFLVRCVDTWKHLPSAPEIFDESLALVGIINSKLTEKQKKKQKTLVKALDDCWKVLREVCSTAKPKIKVKAVVDDVKPLHMFTPKFDISLSQRRANTGVVGAAAGTADKRRLQKRRLQKEMRGAMREVRKDAAFVQGHKLGVQRTRDRERAARVKAILGQLSNQEGDVKKSKHAKFQLI